MNSDMTKYCYQHFENAYNIGWNVNFDSTVESKETFDSIFIEKLTLYCENPLNSDLNGVCRETEIDGKKYVKGFGEIRIIDLKKKIRYAAPNVIIDDILSGKYIPPIEFIDAVLTGPTFDSEEYQEFYLNYSEKNFWGENEENLKNKQIIIESISKTRQSIDTYENDINALEKDIVKQNTKLTSINYEIDSLKQNIEKLQKEKNGLSSNLDYTSNKIESIEQNIKEIELKEAQNKKKIEELSKIQETHNDDFDKEKKQIESLKLDFVQKSEIFKSTEAEINRIETEIDDTNKKIIDNIKSNDYLSDKHGTDYDDKFDV